MTTFPQQLSMKHEESDAIAHLLPVKKFSCSSCGFMFSKENYLLNHVRFCKDVENPAGRLGAGTTTLKNEPYKEEIGERLDEFATTEPTLDVKVEEVEFTETSVSGSTCTGSGHSMNPPRAETPEKVFPLSKFDYAAAQSTQLTGHVEVWKPKKPFKCNICDYTTVLPGSLKAHKQRHARNESLTVQMRKQEMRTQKPFKCTMCDFSFAKRGGLTQHMRTHTGDRPFMCTLCDYASALRGNIVQHMRKHTGEKPFKCTLCDYASSQNGALIRHIRTHTGEKPFKCTVCDYSSSQNGPLILHMRSHTGEKPFKCTLCDYSYARKSTLLQHIRIHTGEKPFKCTICVYASACRSNLRVHIKSHTRE